MWKKYIYKIFWLLVTLGFLSIPWADFQLFEDIPLYPLDGIALLVGIVSLGFFWKEKKAHFFFPKRDTCIIGLFLVLLLSSFFSWQLNGSTLTGLGQLKSWIGLPGSIALLGAYIFRSYLDRNRQLLLAWFVGLLGLFGILLPYIFFGNVTFDGRLQGPFTSPNFLAFFLFPGVLLSYYYFQVFPEKKYLFLFSGFFFFILLTLTKSFGGLLALTGMLTWYIVLSQNFFLKIGGGKLAGMNNWFERKSFRGFLSCCAGMVKNQKQILYIVFFVATFLSVGFVMNERLQGVVSERSSFSSRITIWSVALQAAKAHPVIGIGIGNFQEVYLAYQPWYPPYLEWAVPQPHNIVLALWLQLGLFGLFAMGWLSMMALVWKKNIPEEQKILQAIFFGILVYGIFDTPLFGNALAFVWWFTLANLLFSVREKEITR